MNANIGRDRESGGNRKSEATHAMKASALSTKKNFLIFRAFSFTTAEGVDQLILGPSF